MATPPLLKHVEYAAVSDRGGRPYNQDTFILLPHPFAAAAAAAAPSPAPSPAAGGSPPSKIGAPRGSDGGAGIASARAPHAAAATTTAATTTAAATTATTTAAAATAAATTAAAATAAAVPTVTQTQTQAAWLFAVLDGHGQYGREVAHYLRDRLPTVLRAHRTDLESSDPEVIRAAMTRSFTELQHALAHFSGIDLYLSGSTAAVALLFPNHLVTAHVGDSRIVLGQQHKGPTTEGDDAVPHGDGHMHATQLTRDHTWEVAEEAKRASERSRLEVIDEGGPLRLFNGSMPYPGIVVSRAFGDNVAARLGVSHTPDVMVRPWKVGDRILVLASDGLWDTVTPKSAVKEVSSHETVRKGCETLCDSAIKEPDSDNVTVIVVTLHFHENEAASSSDATAVVTEGMAALTTGSTASTGAPSASKE